jgi:hypothetical protein
MNEAAAKVCSVRHYCFVRGVIGKNPDADFRQAFRTLNRLYVAALRGALEGQRSISKPPATSRRKAA